MLAVSLATTVDRKAQLISGNKAQTWPGLSVSSCSSSASGSAVSAPSAAAMAKAHALTIASIATRSLARVETLQASER